MCRKSNGTWRCLRSARFSGRALCFLLCIALLLLPSPIFGLSPTERLNSIERRLQSIVIYSQKLEEELANSQRISGEQQKHIEQLLSELAGLKTRLEASRSLLEKYKSRAGELLSTIEQLETRLKQLSESYENTVRPLQEALRVAEKEIRVRKIRSVIMAVAAFLAGVGLGYGLKAVVDGR